MKKIDIFFVILPKMTKTFLLRPFLSNCRIFGFVFGSNQKIVIYIAMDRFIKVLTAQWLADNRV